MKKYAYALDPVCLVACGGYVLNRWCLPLALRGPFLRHYFNDLLLIPAAVPLALWLQRRCGLRRSDTPPGWREVLLHLAVWSVTAEGLAPHLFARATGDWWDVAAYSAGAVVATVLWSGA